MIFNSFKLGTSRNGYIAGVGDGIVTVAGKPASRQVLLFNAKSMQLVDKIISAQRGNYMFANLNINNEYLVMVRDYKKEYEPFCWDRVKPADDLTIEQQQALWASWQTT